MEVKVQKLLVLARACILAVLALSAPALPALATAQVPATNASGGQYLPAVPGGGGNVDEVVLVRTDDDRGKGGMKSVAAGSASAADAGIGPMLPVILVLSGLAALFVVLRTARDRRR